MSLAKRHPRIPAPVAEQVLYCSTCNTEYSTNEDDCWLHRNVCNEIVRCCGVCHEPLALENKRRRSFVSDVVPKMRKL